jgi:hypothetical protein
MRYFLIGTLILLTCTLSAQEVKIKFSERFDKATEHNEIIKSGKFYYALDIDSKGYQFAYTAKLSKYTHGISLQKYDENLKKVKSLELEKGDKVFGPFNSRLVMLNDKLILFYYKYPEAETIKLYASYVDEQTLELSATKEIISFSQENYGLFKAFGTSANDNKLFTTTSPDKNKLLVVHSNASQITSCILNKDLVISRNTSTKSPQSSDFVTQSVFLDNSGNKYMAYKFTENKHSRRGIFMQNSSGKEKFQEVNAGTDLYPNDITFKNSLDNAKVWAYGDYHGKNLNEGILLASLDASSLKTNAPHLYPYPDDYKKKLYKLDFGARSRDYYSVRDADYSLHELENGTLALVGYTKYFEQNISSRGGTITTAFAGPIMAAFINGEKSSFKLVPRKQVTSGASDCITRTNKNTIMCIYTDGKVNIETSSEDDTKVISSVNNTLALAALVMDSDGRILSKKVISESPKGGYYDISKKFEITDKNILIPISHSRTTFTAVFSSIVQCAELVIE